jgi:hypothetical protein
MSNYVTVEGFGDQKPYIDAWADQPMTKTQFFLIYGDNGTGRTSICNYIADKFRKNGTILKVITRIPDDDHIGALHKWVAEFWFKARVSNVSFSTVTISFESQIINHEPHKNTAIYKSLLYDALRVQLSGMRLVAIFENVVNPQIFTIVQEVFDDPYAPLPAIALVIFTTTEKDIRKDFKRLNPRPSGLPPIELRVLTGEEVLEFIKQRWKQVQPTSPQPFEEQAVVGAFDQVKYPFQSVVRALEYIFNRKIETLQPGGDWPNDQPLKLDRGDIFQFLFEFYHKYPK